MQIRINPLNRHTTFAASNKNFTNMKKNITLRAEWVIATLPLPQAIKLIVLEAVLAYIVNGYITEIADPQAAEVFATIKADYDAREAKRLERAEKRAAQKAQKA